MAKTEGRRKFREGALLAVDESLRLKRIEASVAKQYRESIEGAKEVRLQRCAQGAARFCLESKEPFMVGFIDWSNHTDLLSTLLPHIYEVIEQ